MVSVETWIFNCVFLYIRIYMDVSLLKPRKWLSMLMHEKITNNAWTGIQFPSRKPFSELTASLQTSHSQVIWPNLPKCKCFPFELHWKYIFHASSSSLLSSIWAEEIFCLRGLRLTGSGASKLGTYVAISIVISTEANSRNTSQLAFGTEFYFKTDVLNYHLMW